MKLKKILLIILSVIPSMFAIFYSSIAGYQSDKFPVIALIDIVLLAFAGFILWVGIVSIKKPLEVRWHNLLIVLCSILVIFPTYGIIETFFDDNSNSFGVRDVLILAYVISYYFVIVLNISTSQFRRLRDY